MKDAFLRRKKTPHCLYCIDYLAKTMIFSFYY